MDIIIYKNSFLKGIMDILNNKSLNENISSFADYNGYKIKIKIKRARLLNTTYKINNHI